MISAWLSVPRFRITMLQTAGTSSRSRVVDQINFIFRLAGLLELFIIMVAVFPAAAFRHRCHFPQAVHRPGDGQRDRVWLTQTRIKEITQDVEGQLEIYARPRKLFVKRKFHGQCFRDNRDEPCFRKETVAIWTCTKREGKFYRIEYKDITNGSEHYTCVQFRSQAQDVIQVWKADFFPKNHTLACKHMTSKREEWPWISLRLTQRTSCPFQGGLDFRARHGLLGEHICHGQWIPSRLESDCFWGEGMDFYFQDPKCNPFNRTNDLRLQCWANWHEDKWLFILLSPDLKQHPRYLMRLPNKGRLHELMQKEETFDAQLYSPPVAPVTPTGVPVTRDITFYTLQVTPSDPRHCYDASRHCLNISQEARCTGANIHYCFRSCKTCSRVPSPDAECRFPQNFVGEWVLVERDRIDHVTITSQHVIIPNLGNFTCKNKQYMKQYYKVSSHFRNGCRMRYTCIHLEQVGDNVLDFRISHSSSLDLSFKLCEFKDDPGLNGNLIRSAEKKQLLASPHVSLNTCGLGGKQSVSASQGGSLDTCETVISDWNVANCSPRQSIKVQPENCRSIRHQEHTCKAYIHLPKQNDVLVTRRDQKPFFTCWVIEKGRLPHSRAPWQRMRVLDGRPCGLLAASPTSLPRNNSHFNLIMQANNAHLYRPCGSITSRVPSTRDTNIKPNIRGPIYTPILAGNTGQRIRNSCYLILQAVLCLYIPALEFMSGGAR